MMDTKDGEVSRCQNLQKTVCPGQSGISRGDVEAEEGQVVGDEGVRNSLIDSPLENAEREGGEMEEGQDGGEDEERRSDGNEEEGDEEAEDEDGQGDGIRRSAIRFGSVKEAKREKMGGKEPNSSAAEPTKKI